MLDLPSTDDGKDIRCFSHHVRQRNAGNERPLLLGNLVQFSRDAGILWILLAHLSPLSIGGIIFLRRFEHTAAERAPGSKSHSFCFRHGQDLALQVPECAGPMALVDAEGGEAVVAGVLVALYYEPGWRVADSEVEDFAASDHVVQAVH